MAGRIAQGAFPSPPRMERATISPTPRPLSPGWSPATDPAIPPRNTRPDGAKPRPEPPDACFPCEGGGALNAYRSLSQSGFGSSCGFGRGVPGGGLGGFPPPLSRTSTSPARTFVSCTRCFFGNVQVFLDMSWYRRSPVVMEI